MSNFLDRYSKKLPFFGFTWKVEVLYARDDYEPTTSYHQYFNNFEVYEYLFALVTAHWQDTTNTVNYMLMSMFMSDEKIKTFSNERYTLVKFRITLYLNKKKVVPNTLKDLNALNRFLLELAEETFLPMPSFKKGEKLSTLGES